MTEQATLSGGCLCGAVRYEANTKPEIVGECYCIDCRKSSGTGHCTNIAVPKDAFSVSGQLKFYDKPADSGNIVSRGFCPDCGSPVYSVNSGWDGMAFIRASSLDDPNAVTPMLSVYTSRAPSWDQPNADLPGFPEMPPDMPME